MNGDSTGCSYSSNNQNIGCDNSSDGMSDEISYITGSDASQMDNDVQVMNNCDSDDNSTDERLRDYYSKLDKEEMFPKKRKIKFNYVQTCLIEKNPQVCDGKIIKSIYLTSSQSNGKWKRLKLINIEDQLKAVARSTIELRETNYGLIVLFYDDEDFIRMTKMKLSKLFDTPITIWNLAHNAPKLNNVILIRDIPWCVKIKEIEDVLRSHKIQPLHSSRIEDGIIRVVVKNSYALPKLVREGFNFYNCINLPVFIEPHSQLDIIQCYRCQRFWHTAQYCPFFERCVRCGDKHDLKKCTRDRNNPNCCLCGDSHHAAYKFCPVRIQHLNAVQVEMNMQRE